MKYSILLLFLTGCMSFTRGSGEIDPNSIKITCENECIVGLERRVQLLEFYVERLQTKAPNLKDCHDYGMGIICSTDLGNEVKQ
jgi:hypothetical protein